MPHTRNKWVIVFLIYADFRKTIEANDAVAFAMTEQMKATLNSLLKDILTVPLDPSRARMYVVMNSIDYKEGANLPTQSRTLLYTIGNPNRLGYNEIRECEVLDECIGTASRPNPGNVVQKADILKGLLKQRICVDTKQEHVFFITWDHGSAFGIFREAEEVRAERRTPIYFDLEQYPYLAAFWNKAVEKHIGFENLVKHSKKEPLPLIVQIHHTPFKIVANAEKLNFLQFNISSEQKYIPMKVARPFRSSTDLVLTYNNANGALEILDRRALSEDFLNTENTYLLSSSGVTEILRNEELAEVFDYWLNGEKVSVLLMMNCWMMNLHTMYSLQKNVHCLVAPQGDIGTPGYNYKDVLRYLFDRNNLFVSPQELAIKCVKKSENNRMRKRSKKLRSDHLDMIDHWKIFAMDLQIKQDKNFVLIEHLKQLAQLVLKLFPKNQQDECRAITYYTDIRLVSFDFTKDNILGDESCFIIDILNWLRVIYRLGISSPLGQSTPILSDTVADIGCFLDEVEASSSQWVLSKSNGQRIYETAAAIVPYSPTGCGLFFPNYISTNENLINNVQNDSLLSKQDFAWSEFIKAVYPKEIWEPFFES